MKKFIIYSFLQIIFMILCYCTNWVVCLFAKENGELPRLFKYWQAWDDSLDNNTSINALSTTGNSYSILSVNSSNVTTVGNSAMDTWVVSKTVPKWNNGTTTVNLATINDTGHLELSNGAELWIG